MTDFIEERLANIERNLDRIATVLERALSEHPVHADDDPGEMEQSMPGADESQCPNCGAGGTKLELPEQIDTALYVCTRCGNSWTARR